MYLHMSCFSENWFVIKEYNYKFYFRPQPIDTFKDFHHELKTARRLTLSDLACRLLII